ncbi:hypothetical protein FRX31_009130 [Thalictrum thalictroides]|uniref:Uncharacterized protein n=1 Tax=Thalictrum thalictroides TaxID=46969 RepID=A0A7J6WW53_THATH|nr:hypothetical protein FRX31_009130 [Thalictrum thalictroides]
MYWIWQDRNTRIFKNTSRVATQLANLITNAVIIKLASMKYKMEIGPDRQRLMDLWNIQIKTITSKVIYCSWEKPSPDWYTLKSDSTLQQWLGVWAAVVRSTNGDMIAACKSRSQHHTIAEIESADEASASQYDNDMGGGNCHDLGNKAIQKSKSALSTSAIPVSQKILIMKGNKAIQKSKSVLGTSKRRFSTLTPCRGQRALDARDIEIEAAGQCAGGGNNPSLEQESINTVDTPTTIKKTASMNTSFKENDLRNS